MPLININIDRLDPRVQSWQPLLGLCSSGITSSTTIKFGRLAIYNGDLEEALAIYGNLKAQPSYPVFRLVLLANIVFLESYILKEVFYLDLTEFFKVKSNSLKNAELNVSAHYDSNDMFSAFLSPDITCSCPIWLPKSDPRSATNFATQAVYPEQRIRAAGLADGITVQQTDYRDLQTPTTRSYDKIISIEMLEAVGAAHLETYFAGIDRLLKRDGGVVVFQCITIPNARHAAYARSDDFIRRCISLGGHLPAVTRLNIGSHYAKATRLWREAFLREFGAEVRPALRHEHAGMGERDMEVFRRKWECCFAYSEAGFATRTLGDVVVTVTREGVAELMEDVQL
ncbi:uncharacterized protein K441DRAFT_706407 [Cenococcum geophilum 1.58]|uniref:uncharacterized protein n=1 Tax=Cenococcum geophilum 1.58 TaxID=794803 RepID=UPI00358F9888|nr:hypothetical protein K441DRAFT_706407 [Cenococcum geophilum 1.58]